MRRQLIMGEVVSTWHMGWPLMAAQFLSLSMSFVDNVMVGHLGTAPLAALAMGTSLRHFILVSAIGVLAALSPLMSQAYGRGRSELIGPYMRNGLLVSLLFSGVMALVCFNSETLLVWLKQEADVAPLAQTYLTALIWGTPANLAFLCLRHFPESVSDTRPTLIIAAVGALANVFVDYALIYGKFGFPALGVRGAGYATAFVHWLMFLGLLGYLFFKKKYRSHKFWRFSFSELKGLGEILRLGIPMSAAMICEMSFFVGVTLLAGTLGAGALAAHQVAINAASLVFMVPLGLSFAVGIRVGQYVGKGSQEGVRASGGAGFLLCCGLQMITAVVFLFFPEAVVRLYSSDPQILSVASVLVRIAGIFQLFDGLQVVGIGALRGLKDTRVPFFSTVASFWILGLPVGYALTFFFDWGPSGLWVGMLLGLGAASCLHWIRFHWLTVTAVQHKISYSKAS